jgi:hypothetical protein
MEIKALSSSCISWRRPNKALWSTTDACIMFTNWRLSLSRTTRSHPWWATNQRPSRAARNYPVRASTKLV